MTAEIERKWVAPEVPAIVLTGSGERLRQGYLARERDIEVRVRLTPRQSTITIKAGAGLRRTEVEVELAAATASELWELTGGRRIDKTRHLVDVGERTAEVDVYADALEGLCTIEVEFESTSDAQAFVAPSWFGAEVTGVPGWSNASLAEHGPPH